MNRSKGKAVKLDLEAEVEGAQNRKRQVEVEAEAAPKNHVIPMEEVSEIVNIDDYDDDGFFYTPNVGKTNSKPISVERYNHLKDLNLAIVASHKPSRHSNFIDLSHHSYFSDDEVSILDYIPKLTPPSTKTKKNQDRIFSPEKGQSSHSKSNPDFVCEICVEPKPSIESFLIKGCKHSYCKDCMTKYVACKLGDNITNISCPVSNCEGLLEPEYCREILPEEVFDRWGNALCENVILGSEKFYCPYKDCSAMMIDDGDKSIKASECVNCWRLFCAQCKVPWHSEINCEEFQKLNKDEREREDIMLMKLAENKHWRRCPNCRAYVERTQGCRHMLCRCGTSFCYGCGGTKTDPNTHYCSVCRT